MTSDENSYIQSTLDAISAASTSRNALQAISCLTVPEHPRALIQLIRDLGKEYDEDTEEWSFMIDAPTYGKERYVAELEFIATLRIGLIKEYLEDHRKGNKYTNNYRLEAVYAGDTSRPREGVFQPLTSATEEDAFEKWDKKRYDFPVSLMHTSGTLIRLRGVYVNWSVTDSNGTMILDWTTVASEAYDHDRWIQHSN